ncbi:MAG: prepilin-type N-terminal cleavage/methylation domain-containing protein [Vulcanimicrobiota bacterium]
MRFCCNPKGFTLLEALVTCLLLLVLLAMVALTVQRTNRVLSQSHLHDQVSELRLCLQSVAREASTAVLWQSSTPLQFQRIDPSDPNRLPAQLWPVPLPMPDHWEPKDPIWLETVTYELDNGQLTRSARFSNGTRSRTVLFRDLQGFSGQLDSQRYLELRARLNSGQLVSVGGGLL